MEELPGEAQVLGKVSPAVERVADDLVVDVAHVHADLVGAPRVEVALEQRVALVAAARLEALEHAEGRDGLAGTGVVGDRHADAVARRAGDAGVDGAGVGRDVAPHERDVATVERAQADEVLQGLLGLVVLGREHEARGVHVEAVHDARAVVALERPQVRESAVGDEGVGERVVDAPEDWGGTQGQPAWKAR